MRRLSEWIWSRRSGRLALALLLLTCVLPLAFLPFVRGIEAATGGLPPFDIQGFPSPDELLAQLSRWPAEARALYRWFAAIDFVFPPTFGFGGAFAWAWLLAKLPAQTAERWVARGLLAVPLLSPACDWVENLGHLVLLAADGPELARVAAHVAVAGKLGKYLGLSLTSVGTLALVVALVRARAQARPR